MSNHIEIKNLTSVNSYTAVIKAEIIMKKEFRTKNGNEGMNIILQDIFGDKIQATLWNDSLKKFNTLIETGKMYEFKNFKIQKEIYKQYNKTTHDYILIISEKTQIKVATKSFMRIYGEKKLECVQINNKIRKHTKKGKTLTNNQTLITTHFQIKEKQNKENISKIANNNKQLKNNAQPIITNFFKPK